MKRDEAARRGYAVLSEMQRGEPREWTADRKYRCPDGNWLRLDVGSDEPTGTPGDGWTQITLLSDDGQLLNESGWWYGVDALKGNRHWLRELLELVDAQPSPSPDSN